MTFLASLWTMVQLFFLGTLEIRPEKAEITILNKATVVFLIGDLSKVNTIKRFPIDNSDIAGTRCMIQCLINPFHIKASKGRFNTAKGLVDAQFDRDRPFLIF